MAILVLAKGKKEKKEKVFNHAHYTHQLACLFLGQSIFKLTTANEGEVYQPWNFSQSPTIQTYLLQGMFMLRRNLG